MAFDMREHTDRASAITPDSVDTAAFRRHPLAPSTIRCLQYLRNVERYTIMQLRDALVTPSHTEPVVTEFLTGWAYQQFWLGETLDAIIGRSSAPTAPAPGILQEIRDRVAPVRQALLANLIGEDFVAIHMAWAYLDTCVTAAAYANAAHRDAHPQLTTFVDRVQQLKQTHRDFHVEQATARLAASRRARALARKALTFLWRPPGAAIHARRETSFVLTHLFDYRQTGDLDKVLDTLPGLSGLRIVSSAMATFGVIRP